MRVLARAADRLIELAVPRAEASASDVQIYCGCIDGHRWYKDCEVLPTGLLRCFGCNITSSTKC
jgi:hypothetical protein